MKKSLFFLSIFLILSVVCSATRHIVQVSNFQFSPSSMNVFVGDTVRFTWVSGGHTTTCDPGANSGTSLPAGAATWNSPMNNGTTTYDYAVTVSGTYNYVCLPHAPNMAGSFVAQQNLPLKLSSFNLVSAGSAVALNWRTASEQNTDHFEIRKSIDGTNFAKIGTIPAAVNSSDEKIYSFTDENVTTQRFYYYNIATVDKDGKQIISETRLFKNTKASGGLIINLSPNPLSSPGHLNLSFNAEKEGKMQVQIVNAEGKTIVNRSMQAYAGVNKGHVHLGEQRAGTYTLICTMDGVTESHQLIYK